MIFVTDLDKTFLRSDLSVSEFSKNVWNNFKYPLTIATARSYTSTSALLKGLKLNYPLILLDGAMISAPNGDIIKTNSIEKEKADEIIYLIYKKFNEYPLIVGFNTPGDEKFLYAKKLNPFQKELIKNYQNDKRVTNLDNLKALKHNLKMVYMGSKELLEEIEKEIKIYFDVETKLMKDSYMPCFFLTILNPLADKANALKKLEEILNVNKEEVTVFGDSVNDIGMFEYAGKKIAVKNAIDEVKKRADIVLPHTNDEDGVAKYLYQLKMENEKNYFLGV